LCSLGTVFGGLFLTQASKAASIISRHLTRSNDFQGASIVQCRSYR